MDLVMTGAFSLDDNTIDLALNDVAALIDLRDLMRRWDHLATATRRLVTLLANGLECSPESVVERLSAWARFAVSNPNAFHNEFLRVLEAKAGRDLLHKHVTKQTRSTMRTALSRAGVSKPRARRLDK